MDIRTFGIEKFYKPVEFHRTSLPITFPISCDSFGEVLFTDPEYVTAAIFFSNEHTTELACVPYVDMLIINNILSRALETIPMPNPITHRIGISRHNFDNRESVANRFNHGILLSFSIPRSSKELPDIIKLINYYVSTLDTVSFVIEKLKDNHMSSTLIH